jgi:c-di-GMP-binding flagellar brake protein YcgR
MKKEIRREFPRLEFNVEFKHWVLNEPSPKLRNNKGKNISAGGICIMIFEKLKIGALLKLELSLRDADKPTIIKGKVVWIEEVVIYPHKTQVYYNCGIEFIDISLRDQENINHYVMRNIKKIDSANS